ncbi:hypothetical protein J1614_004565 [Plenodomus biglobosus]|nr:hypothetical protein J1614_004565 [Plenodomus biglobosus]
MSSACHRVCWHCATSAVALNGDGAYSTAGTQAWLDVVVQVCELADHDIKRHDSLPPTASMPSCICDTQDGKAAIIIARLWRHHLLV